MIVITVSGSMGDPYSAAIECPEPVAPIVGHLLKKFGLKVEKLGSNDGRVKLKSSGQGSAVTAGLLGANIHVYPEKQDADYVLKLPSWLDEE